MPTQGERVRTAYLLKLAEQDISSAVEHRKNAKAALVAADDMLVSAASRLQIARENYEAIGRHGLGRTENEQVRKRDADAG
jgi:hypothetical protein